MTEKPKLVKFGSTPAVIPVRPVPPQRITKKGLVQLKKTPEISEDLTVGSAIDQVVKALTEEAGEEDVLPLQTVLNWLIFIQETADFIDQEEGKNA